MPRHLAAALLGAAVALADVAVHRRVTFGVPWGLALVVTATGAACWWLATSGRPRLVTSFAAGWLLLFSGVLLGRPEGDYALAGDVRGVALMVCGLLLVVVGVAMLGRRGPTRPTT